VNTLSWENGLEVSGSGTCINTARFAFFIEVKLGAFEGVLNCGNPFFFLVLIVRIFGYRSTLSVCPLERHAHEAGVINIFDCGFPKSWLRVMLLRVGPILKLVGFREKSAALAGIEQLFIHISLCERIANVYHILLIAKLLKLLDISTFMSCLLHWGLIRIVMIFISPIPADV
jgi:hypothetical protein